MARQPIAIFEQQAFTERFAVILRF